MTRYDLLVGGLCLAAVAGCRNEAPVSHEPPEQTQSAASDRRSRRFSFTYAVTVHGLPPGAAARVWVPVAQSNTDQQVEIVRIKVPAPHRFTMESTFGNRLLYFEASASHDGTVPIEVQYTVQRFEVTESTGPSVKDAQPFLAHSRLAPGSGETVSRLHLERALDRNPREVGRQLYDAVDSLLIYEKSQPGWGRGDVDWACSAGGGNCSDFHSVFIAACQDLQIPARFEVGFPLPADRRSGPIEGYHCWARFAEGDHWVAVDISEADKHPELREYYFGNLTPDRLQFTTGRDLVLEPPQGSEPVNFLVYPHVEVDGRPHNELQKNFRFIDLEQDG